MITLITTFSPKGYAVYGRRMIGSVANYWPQDVRFLVYHEGEKPEDAHPRAEWVSLDDDKDRAAFMASHKDVEQTPGDYRFRVVRYSHKVWAITGAPRSRYMIWLDADSETLNPVTHDYLRKLLPSPAKVAAYLGRPYHKHSETGFISFDTHAGGSEFLDELRKLYISGAVKTLPEWHDCMAFDFVRRKFERAGYRFDNLCPDAIGLSVFEQSPLDKIVKHNKGPERKEIAYGDPMLEAV